MCNIKQIFFINHINVAVTKPPRTLTIYFLSINMS